MWFTELVTPVTTTHWNDGQLGLDDGTPDGSGDFFGALHSQTNMSIVISDSNESLEPGNGFAFGLIIYSGKLQQNFSDRSL